MKDKISLGIQVMADLLYHKESKKYEFENAKQLMDIDKLIEFYQKLCSENQCNFLEAPTKLKKKFNIYRMQSVVTRLNIGKSLL